MRGCSCHAGKLQLAVCVTRVVDSTEWARETRDVPSLSVRRNRSTRRVILRLYSSRGRGTYHGAELALGLKRAPKGREPGGADTVSGHLFLDDTGQIPWAE